MGVFFPANCMSYGRMTTETHTQSDTDKSEDKINEADKAKSTPSTLFQTLQAFNTPQPQPDKYILIYHHNRCLTVLSSLRRSGLPRNSLHVLYCHISVPFSSLCVRALFWNSKGHPCLRFLLLLLITDNSYKPLFSYPS